MGKRTKGLRTVWVSSLFGAVAGRLSAARLFFIFVTMSFVTMAGSLVSAKLGRFQSPTFLNSSRQTIQAGRIHSFMVRRDENGRLPASFQLQYRSLQENSHLVPVITRLEDPRGALWISPTQNQVKESLSGSPLKTFNPVYVSPVKGSMGTVLFPNHSRARVVEGQWKVRIDLFEKNAEKDSTDFSLANNSSIDFQVIPAVAPTSTDQASLKLRFFMSGAGFWTKESVKTDQRFLVFLAHLQKIFDQISLKIEVSEIIDLPEGFRQLTPSQDLSHFEKVYGFQRTPFDGIDIFFTGDFKWVAKAPKLRASSSGVPGEIGTGRGGCLVRIGPDDDLVFPDDIASHVAHEIGHYLGLFHTSDKASHAEDPLTDTLSGPAEFSNLMRPWLDVDHINQISPQQRKVILTHPLIQWSEH